ncbi:MAG TPA: class I SAM-dependent methyltransferase [Thermoanaerobaculia bacterium]|nr:class I SAM-dependent methyltransferase [Thermoanaerobaculia bacterium]
MSLVEDVVIQLPPGRALDLACGRGRWAHWLAERGWEVVAVDRSEEALADVRTPKLKMDLERGAPLPFADATFDLVLIIRFLHRPLFDEAERVLKPGGILITHPKTTGRFGIDPRELAARFAKWETIVPASEAGLAVRRPG